MKVFLVGGAVRDALLGLPVKDRDWVVVGAIPQQLTDQGYIPVGRDFPVFLHPQTREEYALARTERKTGPGYRGFVVHAAPNITLEEDLARRDLTINAMAIPLESVKTDGSVSIADLIDPFHGQSDLQQKILRHVTPAFREDPVRILRLARFAAHLPTFTVASETLHLMQDMVHSGEVDHLVPERVWQELSRGLMAQVPSQMIKVLRQCGALKRLFPAMDVNEAWLQAMDLAASRDCALPIRFACMALLQDVTQWISIRPSTDCIELAHMLTRERNNLAQSANAPDALVDLLQRCDAFRKPPRFHQLLEAWLCCNLASDSAVEAAKTWQDHLAAAQSVATNLIAADAMKSGSDGKNIGEAIRIARVEAVRKSLDLR